ncbi:MAG TPA: sensor domain-containing diguanylate cyclase [bacterium]|nr:sensor domain-containing diguanylate cyclase [bacterium]
MKKSEIQKILRRQKMLSQEILVYQRIMEGMRKGLKFDSLLKLFVKGAQKGLGFKRSGIFLVEPDGKHATLAMGVSARGTFERNKDRIRITPERHKVPISDIVNGYQGYFLSNNIPGRIPKTTSYRVQVLNNAVVPIQVGKGRIIGVLAVDNLFQNKPITLGDVHGLMNYATQVGLAIESFRAHQKAVGLSMTDPMTGLYNRRYFDQALDQEIKRCRRYGRAFSLLLLDIDHFKRINDTYGHGAGDEVIRQVAGLIRRNLRGLDVVARVGGEEFAVILPETPPQNLNTVVQRLLREMRAAKPVPAAMAQKRGRVTFSIGVGIYKGGEAGPAKLMKAADKSLYQAKGQGRDRCGAPVIVQ